MTKTKMNNYYSEINNEIKSLIEQKKYNQALLLVQEELNMPYIPLTYEAQFKKYLAQIKFYQLDTKSASKIIVSIDDFKKVLLIANSERNNKLLSDYLPYLYQFNYRLLLPEILFFLNINTNNNILKTLLLIELIKMNIDNKIEVTKNNHKITINPTSYNFDDENSKLIKNVADILRKLYFTDSPQSYKIAISALNYIDLYVFPFQIHAAKQNALIKTVKQHVEHNLALTPINLAIFF